MSTPAMRRFLRARSLLFSLEGRIARSTFWATTLALALGYLALLPSAELLPAGAGVVAHAALAGAVAARTVPPRQAGRSPRLEVEQRETG